MLRKIRMSVILAVAACGMATAPSNAVVLYSNLVPDPGLMGDQSINGTTGAIFDDALIDNPVNNPTNLGYALIESVTVGILRDVGAAGVTVTGYYGTTTTPGNINDFPILDNPQTSFGSVVVPAFLGGSKTVQYYTFTPASPFVVALNLTDQSTFSEFAIGLQFSNQSPNAWAVALKDLPDSNLDGAWDSDLSNNVNTDYSLQYNQSNIYTTFALQVNGSTVPEPTTPLALIFGGFGLISRRRRPGQSL